MPDYPDVVRATIPEMGRQVGKLVLDHHGLAVRGLLVRHLVMPGMFDDFDKGFITSTRRNHGLHFGSNTAARLTSCN